MFSSLELGLFVHRKVTRVHAMVSQKLVYFQYCDHKSIQISPKCIKNTLKII